MDQLKCVSSGEERSQLHELSERIGSKTTEIEMSVKGMQTKLCRLSTEFNFPKEIEKDTQSEPVDFVNLMTMHYERLCLIERSVLGLSNIASKIF